MCIDQNYPQHRVSVGGDCDINRNSHLGTNVTSNCQIWLFLIAIAHCGICTPVLLLSTIADRRPGIIL